MPPEPAETPELPDLPEWPELPEAPATHSFPSTAAERRRHDLHTTLTTMRLRTQLLLRDARTRDDPASQRLAAGLAAIDGSITTLVRQLDHHDGAADAEQGDQGSR